MPLADCEAERTGGYRTRIRLRHNAAGRRKTLPEPWSWGHGGSSPGGFMVKNGTYGLWIPETIQIELALHLQALPWTAT